MIGESVRLTGFVRRDGTMDSEDRIIEVYVAKDEPDVRMVESAFITAGINCRVVGTTLGAAAGEIPLGIASGPAIWVSESDVEAARGVIQELEAPQNPFRIASWQCPKCDSEVDSGFDMCWNCLYNPRAC